MGCTWFKSVLELPLVVTIPHTYKMISSSSSYSSSSSGGSFILRMILIPVAVRYIATSTAVPLLLFLLPAVLPPPMRHARSALHLGSTSVPRLCFSTVSNSSDRRENRGRHPHCPLDGGRREAREQDQEQHEYRRLREDCQRCGHLRAGGHRRRAHTA